MLSPFNMAARGKLGSQGFTSMDQLASRLAELELENKNLRKQLTFKSGSSSCKGGGGTGARDTSEPILTEAQKEALLAGLLSRLTTAAAAKIEARLRTYFKKVTTRSGFDQHSPLITMRIDLSWNDIQNRASVGRSSSVKRQRASSRSRASE